MHIFGKRKITIDILHGSAGMSLIDAIIGTALFLVVFMSMFGVFKLSIEIIAVNKSRVGALALMQEQAEYMRSLSYDDVGTVGGIPSGEIPQMETVVLNGTSYVRRVLVQYVDDEKDGLEDEDENGLNADYKVVKIELTWDVRGRSNSAILVTNIVPKGIESIAGGGTLIIHVLNALGAPVEGATVHIENNSLNPVISLDVFTNANGSVMFPGSPSGDDYEVTVSKTGYSSTQTYDVDAININPTPRHLSILEGETTSLTFQIDKVSSKTVRTFKPITDFLWTDLLENMSNIPVSSDVVLESGALKLADSGGYAPSGFAQTSSITHAQISEWIDFSWQDDTPLDTDVLYKIYYDDGVNGLQLLPDAVLVNNSIGFSDSPIDLSVVDAAMYPALAVGAFLSTSDALNTPSILEWNFSYRAGPIPFPNVPFNMRSDKVIGENGLGETIYKYDTDLQTMANGTLTIPDLEWGNYEITIDNSGFGYDISEICAAQPRSINPDISTTTDMILVPHTNNSLLVSVENSSASVLVGATVHLFGHGSNIYQETSSCGQTFFPDISAGATYTLEVGVGAATTTVPDVNVSGASYINVTTD